MSKERDQKIKAQVETIQILEYQLKETQDLFQSSQTKLQKLQIDHEDAVTEKEQIMLGKVQPMEAEINILKHQVVP